MNTNKTTLPDYRYERKYLLTDMDRRYLEVILKLHPSLFSEIYHPRFINNIYLDDIKLKNYFDNVYGNTDRVKVRIRWYGELFKKALNPYLEFKIKNGLVGTKKRYALKDFDMGEAFDYSIISNSFHNLDMDSSLKIYLKTLSPVLLNRYKRKYFLSGDKNFRITIDDNLEYYKITERNNTFLNSFKDYTNMVLELKYDVKEALLADKITDGLPFTLGKNSKYVNGVNLVKMNFY